MKSTFDLQDELFDLFRYDEELPVILGITDVNDIGQCDNKIRRQCQDPTLLTTDVLDFFDYSFVDARPTKNYLVNFGLLEINIFAGNRYKAKLIYDPIKRILKDNYDNMQVYSEGQVNSPIRDIYCYRIRLKPLVNS